MIMAQRERCLMLTAPEIRPWDKALACTSLSLLHPIGYHEMLSLNMQAAIMLTGSGGMQEECCVLGTFCLNLRWDTERLKCQADQ